MSGAESYSNAVERYYKRNFLAAVVDNAMFSFIRIGLSPYIILPFYLEQLTDSNLLIGLIPAVFILGFAAPQLLIARFLQRNKGRKGILVISSVVQRICILGLILLTMFQIRMPNSATIAIFFSIYALYNLGRGVYSPSYIDFIGRVIPRNRGKMIGTSNFLGGVLTLIGTGIITGLFAALPYPLAITAVFSLAFLGSLISLMAILSWKDVLPPEVQATSKGDVRDSIPANPLLPAANFRHYLAWRSVITGLEMMLPFYAIYALGKFDLPDSYVGIFTAILTISDSVMNPIWGWIGDKGGYLKVVIAASSLGCIGAMIAAISNNLPLFFLVFMLNGMMLSGQLQGNINLIYEFAPKAKIPAYAAITQVILSPLSGLAPVLGGILVNTFGNAMSSVSASIIGAAGVTGMALKVRDPKRAGSGFELEELHGE